VRQLARDGITKAEIARRLAIGEASVYRILADKRPVKKTAEAC
jgi:hypothetical protein